MGGQAVRQSGGRWLRLAVGLGGAVLLTAPPADRLSAQVGYDPSHSPFHDVRRGAGLRFATGYLGGDRGTVPVGPSEGPTFGLRFETSLGPVASFTAGFSYGRTTRFIVFPYDSAGKRTKGPFDANVVLADLGLQLSLTGAKTVHGLLPYVGGSLGLAFGSAQPADTIACGLGLPAGFALAGSRFWGRRAALTVVNTALAFPTVVVGLLLYGLLSRRGPLGGLGWLYTWQAIVLGDVVLALPIAAALSAAAVQGVDPRIRRTAETLGAGPLRAARTGARGARRGLAALVTA